MQRWVKSQALFSVAQWQDKKQWVENKTEEVLSEHQEFYCENDLALEQAD